MHEVQNKVPCAVACKADDVLKAVDARSAVAPYVDTDLLKRQVVTAGGPVAAGEPY